LKEIKISHNQTAGHNSVFKFLICQQSLGYNKWIREVVAFKFPSTNFSKSLEYGNRVFF